MALGLECLSKAPRNRVEQALVGDICFFAGCGLQGTGRPESRDCHTHKASSLPPEHGEGRQAQRWLMDGLKYEPGAQLGGVHEARSSDMCIRDNHTERKVEKRHRRYQLVKHAKEAAIIVIPLPRLSFFFSFHLLVHF